MDQMAIDSTDVALERNQSIWLKEIFGEIVSSFSSSGCFELQFPFPPMNITGYITVLNWEKILKRKKIFSNRTISEFIAADLMRNGFVNNLLRFYYDQLALLIWILLIMFRELLSEDYIEIIDNLPTLMIGN